MTNHERKTVRDWVYDPPSIEIAEILNETNALHCLHGEMCCSTYCGVERDFGKRWYPMSLAARLRRVPVRIEAILYPGYYDRESL